MKYRWPMLDHWKGLLPTRTLDEEQQLVRIQLMERNIVLPVKLGLILLLIYYFFFSNLLGDIRKAGGTAERIWELLRLLFVLYGCLNIPVATTFLAMKQFKPATICRVTFHIAWVDALFAGALTVGTGGFDSLLFWGYLFLIARNAVTHPIPRRQILLNGIACACYLFGGIVNRFANLHSDIDDVVGPFPLSNYGAEPFLLRLALLSSMTLACFAVQVLFDKRAEEADAREQALRVQQLQTAGRLAAEIAHQLKNPLGIINTAAFTLQRTVKEGKTITQQIQMIREEVERSDRIITELMGYARLSEGSVEKLSVEAELDHAIAQVFPAAAKYEVRVERDFAAALPPLLMQRSHLSEIFVNILQNAREAMDGKGTIRAHIRHGDDFSIVVQIEDSGPGIPPDKLPIVFEPYFSTKTKGTGLGLSIVKHNIELYGGTVKAESELGRGTRFTINLPAKAVMRIRR